MGKQVSFFMLPSDIDSLEVTFERIEPFIILHSRSNSATPRRLSSINPSIGAEDWLYLYLVRPEDIGRVLLKHVPNQDYWLIDVIRSPVVELQRCFFDGKLLRRGRAFFTEKYYDSNGILIQKTESFKLWAKSVLKAIKKDSNKNGSDYIGKDAAKWLTIDEGKLID